MKVFISLFVLLISVSSFCQKVPEKCNELPFAKVDVKPSLLTDISSDIQNDLPTELKKGEYAASFKTIVSCKGAIERSMYSNGDISEEVQALILKHIESTEWTAAVIDDKYVSATTFIQVEIKNGKVSVSVWYRD